MKKVDIDKQRAKYLRNNFGKIIDKKETLGKFELSYIPRSRIPNRDIYYFDLMDLGKIVSLFNKSDLVDKVEHIDTEPFINMNIYQIRDCSVRVGSYDYFDGIRCQLYVYNRNQNKRKDALVTIDQILSED